MEMNYASPFGMANSRNVPATPPPQDIPVTPLPPIVGEPEPAPMPDIPVIPLPPEDGTPPIPDIDQTPSIPLPPPGSTPPVAPGPSIPMPPIIVPTPGYCTVRFLHAVMDGEPIRISIGPRLITNNLSYGNITNYFNVADGFRTITIYSARNPRVILYRNSVPLNAGEIITMAVVRSGGMLDLVRISDQPCNNRPRNRACIRAINLVYNSPALDVILSNGRAVFTDVRYKEVTPFRQARPQTYDFYIAQTPYSLSSDFSDSQMIEELPMVISDYFLPGFGSVEPLVSFYVDARAGAMESIYILGNWNITQAIRTKVVENY